MFEGGGRQLGEGVRGVFEQWLQASSESRHARALFPYLHIGCGLRTRLCAMFKVVKVAVLARLLRLQL